MTGIAEIGFAARGAHVRARRAARAPRATWSRLCTALVAGFLGTSLLAGCASDTRWSRHFQGGVWGGALEEQVERPDRWVPEGVLLAAVPVGLVYDSDVHHYEEGREVSNTTQNVSNLLQFVLPAIPVGIGTVDWIRGDHGQNFEVAAESLGATVAITHLMAVGIGRARPDGKAKTSFPSGHTAWAFAASTLIVRDLHDPSDDSLHVEDLLIYAPAFFTAWERVAIDHHWTSDVAAGAFLGVLITNWIWDAHVGSAGESRPTIFPNEHRRGVVWSPRIDVIDDHLALGFEAGF